MNRLNGRYFLVIVFAVVVAATAIVPGTADATLIVADADSGDRLLEVAVDDGDEVVLSYTHSVEKTPVQDVYVVDGTELRMTQTVFSSYGAGLPSNQPVKQTDDQFVVRTNDSYDELPVVPGSVAGHELIVDDDHYDLVALSDGAIVVYLSDRSIEDALPLHTSIVPKHDI